MDEDYMVWWIKEFQANYYGPYVVDVSWGGITRHPPQDWAKWWIGLVHEGVTA